MSKDNLTYLFIFAMKTFIFIVSFYYSTSTYLCYNPDSRITFITSFHSGWYRDMRHRPNQYSNTVLDRFPRNNLVIYHEDDLEPISGACLFDLRTIPWFEYNLMDKNSGLNQYYALAGFADPTRGDPQPGQVSTGHSLFMKVVSIYHAVHNSPENSIVFWVDTDVTFREPLTASVLNWIRSKDVSYIPFMTKNPFLIGYRKPWGFVAFNMSDFKHQQRLLQAEFWKVESGLFAFTVNMKTRSFTSKALHLYRGGMYEFARECFNNSEICQPIRVRTNVFLNDIFVFSLLLQSDAHKDSYFYENLKHGWLAMDGLEPWGDNGAVWGAGWFAPNFRPVTDDMPSSIVSDFHIGKYIFHHFGYHEAGVFASEIFNRTIEKPILPTWKVVYASTNLSLYRFLLQNHDSFWQHEYDLYPSSRGKLLLSLPIAYDEFSSIGTLDVYESLTVSWESQVQHFCDKYTIFFGDCAELRTKIGNMLQDNNENFISHTSISSGDFGSSISDNQVKILDSNLQANPSGMGNILCRINVIPVPVHIIHAEGNILNTFEFDIFGGVSLPSVIDTWCDKHCLSSFTDYDNLKVKNYIMKNSIFRLTETKCEALELHMMTTLLLSDQHGNLAQIKFDFDSTKENFITKSEWLFNNLKRRGNLADFLIESKFLEFLSEAWKIIEMTFKFHHFEAHYKVSKEMLQDNKLLISIEIPQAIPTGMGNIFLAYLSCYSFHQNTVIRNLPHFVMGNYSEILRPKHIYSLTLQDEHKFRIETFVASSLLVLREEEHLFDRNYFSVLGRMPNFPNLALLFSNISLSSVYNRSALPYSFVKRILKAVRSIEFLPDIVEAVHNVTDEFVTPVLGISIRSWNGTHEKNYDLNMRFNVNLYKIAISKTVIDHGIRTILCAFDNDMLKSEFQEFLLSFDKNIRVIFFEHRADVTPLQKGAIEMLSLSAATYLIGDKRSSFLQLSYWFGSCRPIVILISDTDLVTSSESKTSMVSSIECEPVC